MHTCCYKQNLKEFPTGIEIQRLAAALRDLYGIQEPKKELQICHFVVQKISISTGEIVDRKAH